MSEKPLLVVVTGATASGKTRLAIELAEHLGCDVISADSRQIYRDIPITTAAPTAEEMGMVRHHFVGTLPLDSYYSAAMYASDVEQLLPRLWQQRPVAVMCGGSMMYIDAAIGGIDPLPTITEETRARVKQLEAEHGAEGLLALLEITDPDYYARVDRKNLRRVMHALEISMQAGVPYSQLCTGQLRRPDFRVLRLAIDMPREQLFGRINSRVERMAQAGMIEEARRVYPLRHLNSLNTVGFKEMFAYFDGLMPLDIALARLAKNTRVYAKKQLTWMQRYGSDLHHLRPDTALDEAIALIEPNL